MKEPFPYDQKDAAVREFKEILHQQVVMLRNATHSRSVYICWVNREREQFVLEAGTTTSHSVMFPDRIPFRESFLNPYRDLNHVRRLRIGTDISKEQCTHHLGTVEVKTMTIIPFLNQGETVALTVLESEHETEAKTDELFDAYQNTFKNLLNNYLQRTSNLEAAGEWERYETSLNRLDSNKHRADLLVDLIAEMEYWMHGASIHLILKTGGRWISILHNVMAPHTGFSGLEVEIRSMASVVLERGEPQFAIHFNQNPKILSSKEKHTNGASYLLPLTIFSQIQGAFIVNHSDPLTLTESMKHKLSNLVRVASLKIEAGNRRQAGEPLFTAGPGCIIPNLWEKSIDTAWQRKREGANHEHTVFAVATLENIRELQTRLRLESLHWLQKQCAEILAPTMHRFRGYVGFRSDYIYPVILFSDHPNATEEWMERVHHQLAKPIQLHGEQGNIDIPIALKIQTVPISGEVEDPHKIIRDGLR